MQQNTLALFFLVISFALPSFALKAGLYRSTDEVQNNCPEYVKITKSTNQNAYPGFIFNGIKEQADIYGKTFLTFTSDSVSFVQLTESIPTNTGNIKLEGTVLQNGDLFFKKTEYLSCGQDCYGDYEYSALKIVNGTIDRFKLAWPSLKEFSNTNVMFCDYRYENQLNNK